VVGLARKVSTFCGWLEERRLLWRIYEMDEKNTALIFNSAELEKFSI
jgi:hypothetical protein